MELGILYFDVLVHAIVALSNVILKCLLLFWLYLVSSHFDLFAFM